jgi:hypothetical protein
MSMVKEKLMRLREAFVQMIELYPKFRMYSSSILLGYDADSLETPPKLVLIDFAHAHFDIDKAGGDSTDSSFDDGVLLGIDTFLRLTCRT